MDEKRFKKGDIIKADLDEAFRLSYKVTFESWERNRLKVNKNPIGNLLFSRIDCIKNYIMVDALDIENKFIAMIKIPFCCILNDNLICYSDE